MPTTPRPSPKPTQAPTPRPTPQPTQGTWAPVKWSDAMDYCAKYGKTLCGSSDSARCQNSGCHYNSIYQWTNEPCEPGDAGYECTAA